MRLIDADKLKDENCEGCNGRIAPNGNCDLCGLVQLINDQPTVDAEPVVRCKDCAYTETSLSGQIGCRVLKLNVIPNGFCYVGIRKDDTDED